MGLVSASPTWANDWEKFYKPFPGAIEKTIASDAEPNSVSSVGDVERDFEAMWRRGYTAIGYTSFETNNNKTKDAFKLAKKLKAPFFMVSTKFLYSETTSIPLTTPNNTTTVSSGSVSASGTGGSAFGTYNGTSTTYGTQTTYMPIQVSRFDKTAVFFREVPKVGTGIFPRDLTNEEVAKFETRRAFAVRYVRDSSPAYQADIFPGDIILKVNGEPADEANWRAAMLGPQPMTVQLHRNGNLRELKVLVPDDWRPKAN